MESGSGKVIRRFRFFIPALGLSAGIFCLPTAAAEWEDGDIVMRHGTGLWSEFFRRSSLRDRRFSHMGIVRVREGKIMCIHSEGNDLTGRGEVKMVPLEEFFEPSRANGHFRLKLSAAARRKFAEAAEERLGTPFDWKFNTDDDRQLYCTELALVALKKAAPEIALRRRRDNIVPPDSLSAPEIAVELPMK